LRCALITKQNKETSCYEKRETQITTRPLHRQHESFCYDGAVGESAFVKNSPVANYMAPCAARHCEGSQRYIQGSPSTVTHQNHPIVTVNFKFPPFVGKPSGAQGP